MTIYNELINRLDRIENRLNETPERLSYEQAERYLFGTHGTQRGALYQKVARRQIPSHKRPGEARYFLRSELDAWLRENRILTDDEISRRR